MADQNEISGGEKITAGVLLVLFTFGAILLLYGYWPDKMPDQLNKSQLYCNKLFSVRMIDDSCQRMTRANEDVLAAVQKASVTLAAIDRTRADSARIDSLKKEMALALNSTKDWGELAKSGKRPLYNCAGCDPNNTISLHKLLFVLVCLGGFLGAMINVSGAFTVWIGRGDFKASWELWYIVKPFTGAGLALVVYFVFRAGFMSYTNDASNLNIFGIMSLAAMTGLFTDIAMKKLKDIFDAAIKPKGVTENAGDKDKLSITGIDPAKIDKTKENVVTIKGKNFDKQQLTVQVNSEKVDKPEIKPDAIVFRYTAPAAQQQATVFKVEVTDVKGAVLAEKDLGS